MFDKVIYSKEFFTSSGQKRKVTVTDEGWRGYRVIKWNIPKKKNSLVWASYDMPFTNKAKAMKKAKSLIK